MTSPVETYVVEAGAAFKLPVYTDTYKTYSPCIAYVFAKTFTETYPAKATYTAGTTITVNRDYNLTGVWSSYASPIILDLNLDGVKTLASSYGVKFDIKANGKAVNTGWVSPQDGLLVRDINGNGQIDSGLELFGDSTILSSGDTAANGFNALADLDMNNDGEINMYEMYTHKLKIWRDDNSNGITDIGELLLPSEFGVQKLLLDYTESDYIDENNNAHAFIGEYIRQDATKHEMTDVYFEFKE
jgi:hypothetical protein